MAARVLLALEKVFLEVVATMDDYFDTHDFLLKLAQAHQRLHVHALARYATRSKLERSETKATGHLWSEWLDQRMAANGLEISVQCELLATENAESAHLYRSLSRLLCCRRARMLSECGR